MPDNLSAYSFINDINLCDTGVCFDIDETALTNGVLLPQTGQVRDGGYSPPPVSVTYTPVSIAGVDNLSLDNYLSEGSTVSVNLSSTSTCVNLATGYDAFNFGYQLLIENHGLILDRTDNFTYKSNTLNITGSGNLTSNWAILSSTARYNKMLSGTGVDLLPVGSYRRTTSPNDILLVKYYSGEYIPTIFWVNEPLNIFKTKKIVWDMSSIRLGGEDLKDNTVEISGNQAVYTASQAKKLTSITPFGVNNVLLSSFFVSKQIGSTIIGLTGLYGQRDGLGYSVDINDQGNRIVVGCPYSDNNFSDIFNYFIGKARVYEFNGVSWVQLGQDLVGDENDDYFGLCVSMNSSGNRIAVSTYEGGSGSDEGYTKIYEWNGTAWIQLGQKISGTTGGDYSGWSVQLNSAGNRIAINDKFRDTVNGVVTGRARVFEYNGSLWVQVGQDIPGQSPNDQMISVTINDIGDIIAYACAQADLPPLTNVGVVRVFKFSNNSWVQLGGDIYGDGEIYLLGRAARGLCLNSSGDTFIVGAHSITGGSALVYKYNGTQWVQLGQQLTYQNNPGATYGNAVSINGSGNRVAIGDWNRNSAVGTVEIYEYTGTLWEKVVNDLTDPTWNNNVDIGFSVSLNKAGDKLVTGGPNSGAGSGGWALVYQLPSLSVVENPITSTLLWSDGVITEGSYDYPFYLPDDTIGYADGGSIQSRTFNVPGLYTLLSNTRTYNISGVKITEEEPYNITFITS